VPNSSNPVRRCASRHNSLLSNRHNHLAKAGPSRVQSSVFMDYGPLWPNPKRSPSRDERLKCPFAAGTSATHIAHPERLSQSSTPLRAAQMGAPGGQRFSFWPVGRARHSVRAGCPGPPIQRRARSDAPYLPRQGQHENCWPGAELGAGHGHEIGPRTALSAAAFNGKKVWAQAGARCLSKIAAGRNARAPMLAPRCARVCGAYFSFLTSNGSVRAGECADGVRPSSGAASTE
jgi:hypothetical protein